MRFFSLSEKRNDRIIVTKRHRPGLFVFSCVILLFVSFFATVVMRDDWERHKVAGWSEVPCEIVDSSVERKNLDDYRFSARFKYEVNGRTFTSSAIDALDSAEHRFNRIEKRLQLLRKYAKGAAATCRVDPDCPAVAVLLLEPSGLKNLLIPLFVIGFFAAVGLSLMMFSFGGFRKKLFGGREENLGAVIGSGLALVFCVVGWSGVVANLGDILMRSNYAETTGKVLTKGIVSHRGSKHTTFAPRIVFAYTVDGMEYESDRYRSSESSTSDRSAQRAIVDDYRIGETIKVWYDTTNPARAQIVKPWSQLADFLTVGFFGIFALIGTLLASLFIRSALKRYRASHQTNEPVVPIFGVRLKRKFGAAFWFTAIFAVVWNVFSWFFVFAFVFASWPKFSWPSLIVLIFPMIGLGLIVQVIRLIIGYFAGTHVALTMTTSGLREGEIVRLDYQLVDVAQVESLVFSVSQWDDSVAHSKNYDHPDRQSDVCRLSYPAPTGSVEFRFPAALLAKSVTREIRVTLTRQGKTNKTLDIFAIP